MSNVVTDPNQPGQQPGQQQDPGQAPPHVADTNSGVIVGATPPAAAQQPQQTTPPQRTFTEEDLERVRQEEKNKLYSRIDADADLRKQLETMQADIDAAKAEREAQAKAVQDADEARQAAERAAEEEKMTAKELVGRVREEMQEAFREQQERTARAEAILEQEHRFQALQEYKNQRLADPEIAKVVMPHLHPFINGNTEQEIEDAIKTAATTSENILNDVRQYQQQTYQNAPGVSTSAPSSGPLETQQQQQDMSPAQIAALSPAEFARLRPQLLRASSQQFYQQNQR